MLMLIIELPSGSVMELGGIPYLMVSCDLWVFDGVFCVFHRLCGIFFVTLQDIRAKGEGRAFTYGEGQKNENNANGFLKRRAKAEPSLTGKVKKRKQR